MPKKHLNESDSFTEIILTLSMELYLGREIVFDIDKSIETYLETSQVVKLIVWKVHSNCSWCLWTCSHGAYKEQRN